MYVKFFISGEFTSDSQENSVFRTMDIHKQTAKTMISYNALH